MAHRSRTARRRPRGFTVIELLVCVGVIGLLLALILPAVFSSRAAAREITCQSRLKQIGTAVVSFEHTFGHYPRGPGSWSVHSDLLPWLGRQTLFEQAERGIWDDACSPREVFGAVQLVEFQCPDDERRPEPMTDMGREPIPTFSSANYLVNAGVKSWTPERGGLNALFEPDLTPADFKDGLSNTAGFSEQRQGDDPNLYVYRTETLKAPFSPDAVTAELRRLSADATAEPYLSSQGDSWCDGGGMETYDHTLTPGRHGLVIDGEFYHSAFPASSAHPRGVHALLMDGAVRPFTRSVSADVWQAVGTRAGGEPHSLH